MPDLPPLTPPGHDVTAVSEWVAEVLRDRIVKGHLPPGARLIERKLSAELDVSRTPIREALKLLQSDRLIQISRNKGAQVTAYDPQEALNLFDVIAALESTAAERVATTCSAADLDQFEDLHARMLIYYKIGNGEDYFDTNSAIHSLILHLADNPTLTEAHTRLMARARRGRFMAIMDPARLREAVDEHEQLMTALRARDSDGARRIWRTHLLHTGRSVFAVLGQTAAPR